MLTRLWSFITGYVTLLVKGRALEKFINMGISRGLYLWDIKWVSDELATVKVRLNAIKALRHIARRTGCTFKITGKSGLPFKIAGIKQKKVMILGILLSIITIYFMSSVIWFIEVSGNKKISDAQVKTVAENAGLAMGTLKLGLDENKIEKYIKDEIPEISWVDIKITGTKAVIEIAEKFTVPKADNSPANIVAEKPGLVKEILVLSGKAEVNEGDMVKKGDVLISGIIAPEIKDESQDKDETEIKPPGQLKFVRAKGMVRARVWYDGYGECRLVEEGTRRTGKKVQVLSIRAFGKNIILKGPGRIPFADYVVDEDVRGLSKWRNINIPVEIVTSNYYEVRKYRDIIDISDAKSIALNKAIANAKKKIPDDARVIREITEEIQARGSNVVRFKAILETLEDIGKTEPLKENIKSDSLNRGA